MDFELVFIVKSNADVFRGFRNLQDALTDLWFRVEEDERVYSEDGIKSHIYPMLKEELSSNGECGFWIEKTEGPDAGTRKPYEIVRVYCQSV